MIQEVVVDSTTREGLPGGIVGEICYLCVMMNARRIVGTLAALLLMGLGLRAQSFEPYIPEEEMPDVVKIVPAPPKDPSPEFDHDILRYMWGKQ